MRDALSNEVGQVIRRAQAIATKIGQQGNEDVALQILKVAELALIRKALLNEVSASSVTQPRGSAWKVQHDMELFPTTRTPPDKPR